MKKFIFLFLFLLASCGNPCDCDNLSIDPFNSSPLPSGCGCSVGKIYVPDISVDVPAEVTPTKKPDVHTTHTTK